MPDVLLSGLAPQVGAGGLLAVFILALVTGRLITRSSHQDRIADKDAQIAYLHAALDKRDEQVRKLLEGQELSVRATGGSESQGETPDKAAGGEAVAVVAPPPRRRVDGAARRPGATGDDQRRRREGRPRDGPRRAGATRKQPRPVRDAASA
jgi:hypothetical protein